MKIAALLGAGLLFAVTTLPSHACECITMDDTTVELAFEGRVLMLDEREQPTENFDPDSYDSPADNPVYAKARLRILTLYQGYPPQKNGTVKAYIDGATSCGMFLQTGDVADFTLVRRSDVLVQIPPCDSNGSRTE